MLKNTFAHKKDVMNASVETARISIEFDSIFFCKRNLETKRNRKATVQTWQTQWSCSSIKRHHHWKFYEIWWKALFGILPSPMSLLSVCLFMSKFQHSNIILRNEIARIDSILCLLTLNSTKKLNKRLPFSNNNNCSERTECVQQTTEAKMLLCILGNKGESILSRKYSQFSNEAIF